ncbi:FecR family protein [Marixanthomonas spongiae]|uniref:FecR family protein n=1 Tax=Marixanthomonas spongiae TaxID=2174845 RepID=A0A2U0HUU7_9FLAO|nr:FecR family protein [Marixanthomonas spongiae]PVW12617.1 hypothetical protein DDV96_14715 [Marixanthomonas spongiae]
MNTKQANELFKKYVNGNCSSEELELLEAFLDSYQDNKVKNISDLGPDGFKAAKERMWQNISEKLTDTASPVKKNHFKSYFLYAAAATLAIIVAVSFFYTYQKNTNNTTISETETIMTGSDKATLTLGDGTQIALEKNENFKDNYAESNGEKIVYNRNTNTETAAIKHNSLTIPRGGQFFVELADGTKVWLNSESKIKYPIAFTEGKTRTVELIYGEAYFDVSPSTEHKGGAFQVISRGQNIEVLGTQFNVKAYQDEKATYTTLVEGKIALQAKDEKVVLKPKQQAIVVQGNETIAINTVEVYNEISWKDGIFSFKGKPLKEIMKVISRWYDVDVEFENKQLSTMTFKGVLSKNQQIENILSAIKSASVINDYELKENTVILK